MADDATYSDGKDLAKRTIDGYQRTLASISYTFFDEKTRSGISVNEQLADEWHTPVIKKIQNKKSIRKI